MRITIIEPRVLQLGVIVSAAEKAQRALSKAALADCNAYCRVYGGRLFSSAHIERESLLVWETPYARRVYYTGEPRRGVNPRASLMWAHKAAALNVGKWRDLAAKAIGEVLL